MHRANAGCACDGMNPIGQRANADDSAFAANSLSMELDDGATPGVEGALISDHSLRRARSELERASRLALAGELVAAVTHDLRQPLTALQMNVAAAVAFLRRSTPAITDALA